MTANGLPKGAGRIVAAGATARGGYDTYRACNKSGVRSAACTINAVGTLMSAADPFLPLSAADDLIYNMFGSSWASATPQGDTEGCW
jgi:hypothetical protein